MFTAPGQPDSHDSFDFSVIPDLLGTFENWLLDLVSANGIASVAGYAQWHRTPIDLWVLSQGYSWDWADKHPIIREYRRLTEAVHNSFEAPVLAYEALAVLSLMRTLIRYRMT